MLGEDHVPLEPAEGFLSYLSLVERFPSTVKAYAHDLKDWFTFLTVQGLDWRSATVGGVATFVGWLRLPPTARDGNQRAAYGRASLHWRECEPQARSIDLVLRLPRSARGAAGDLVGHDDRDRSPRVGDVVSTVP